MFSESVSTSASNAFKWHSPEGKKMGDTGEVNVPNRKLADNASQAVSKKRVRQVLIDKLQLGPLARETKFYRRNPLELRLLDTTIRKLLPGLISPVFMRSIHIPASETVVTDDEICQWFMNNQGATRLHRRACKHGLESLEATLRRDCRVDVNAKSLNSGSTPLLKALQNNHVKIAEELLKNGSNPEIRDDENNVPLFTALIKIKNDNDCDRIVKLMITKGVNIKIHDKYSLTPIDLAAENGHLKTMLTLLQNGCFTITSSTLMYAAASKHRNTGQVIRYIIKKTNLDPSLVYNSKKGMTYLMYAAESGNYWALEALLEDRRVKRTINDRNHKKTYTWTAYTYADDNYRSACKEILLRNGAKRKKSPHHDSGGGYVVVSV